MKFSQEKLDRHNSQIMLDGWGIKTQKDIKDSSVFIAGAGVGTIRISISWHCLTKLFQIGMNGRVAFIKVRETPCLKCYFPESPPKGFFSVLGATPGVIGTLQALEALKYFSHDGKVLKGSLLVWSGSDMSFRTFRGHQDSECPSCGTRITED